MSKITVVHISDIHYERNEPENQGLVINSFFEDLNARLSPEHSINTFCVISGDLVNKGNSDTVFDSFYDKFIIRLTKLIPLENIFCSAGNHDFDRGVIEQNIDEHNEILSRRFSESEFNDFINDGDNLIRNKFKYFEKFCTEKMQMSSFNLSGYEKLLAPELTAYFLNCSLFCSGGLNGIQDKGVLKIVTSGLNEWIQKNRGRTRMLVMHHPEEYLTDYAKSELKSILKGGVDILITGHVHDQYVHDSYIYNSTGLIKLGSPQLFSSKHDLNGYGILSFDKGRLIELEYRKWVLRQRKFMSGQDFSGTDNGKVKFDAPAAISADFYLQKLQENLKRAMRAYSKNPVWVNRKLTSSPPSFQREANATLIDYIDIVNNPINYQIIAAPQFGLTCFAKFLALKAYEIKKESWLYLNSKNWSYGSYHSDLDDALSDLNTSMNEVNCVLLDNWKNSSKDSSKILANLKGKLGGKPIIIFSNFHDNIVLDGLDSEESHEGFEQVYLCELSRRGIRNLVQDFNSEFQIAEENQVVERLNIDLIDLNAHRTPLNCIQLLIAFLNDFENRPINRSKVFKYILKVVFDNPGTLFHGDTLDEDNCGFIVGYFCEVLLREKKEHFTEEEFLNKTRPFCIEHYNTSNVSDLLQVLKNHQIVTSYNGKLSFRFSYWIYYFAALRMKDSEDFAQFMLTDRHSLYFPEIIEFYTGIDGRAEDIVEMLVSDLTALSTTVADGLGLKTDLEIYKGIKWSLRETVSGMTQGQLEENIRASKVSDEIKDIVADKNYNSIKPYSQTIHNYLEEHDVQNLMQLIKSSSRALRNSEFVKPRLKEELLGSISLAWKALLGALYLIAPVLAKNGFGGVGGARFELDETFPEEFDECLKKVIMALPYSLHTWFKDDLFSDKLRMLFRDFRIKEQNTTVRHILAIMECDARPEGWKDSISKYISQLNKNSYYLGSLYTNLRSNYATSFMTKPEQSVTEYLVKACWAKHNTGSPMPGIDTVSKVPDEVLPNRNIQGEE